MERIGADKVLGAVAVLVFAILFYGDDDCDGCYTPSAMAFRAILAGAVVMLAAVYYYMKFLSLEKILFCVDRQPVLSAALATEGVPYSSEGKLIPIETMTAPISKRECVYYHVIKERLEKSGKSTKWVMKENVMAYKPFYVEDKSGRLLVDLMNVDHDFSDVVLPIVKRQIANPQNSEVDSMPVICRQEYKIEKHMAADERWRQSEYILTPGQDIFVYGMVFKGDEEEVLRESPECPLIVSRKTKERYVNEFFTGPSLWYVSNLVVAFGLILLMAGVAYFAPNFFMPGMTLGLFLIVGQTVVRSYNRLVLLRERVENSASEISLQLKKRADLLPQLEEVVKGYAKHEATLNQLIANMRADLLFYPIDKGTKKDLIAVLEAYPKLQASGNFKSLMLSVEKLEESIAQVREFYNRSVLKYNNLCQQFPTVIIAKIAGMKPAEFMDRYRLS